LNLVRNVADKVAGLKNRASKRENIFRAKSTRKSKLVARSREQFFCAQAMRAKTFISREKARLADLPVAEMNHASVKRAV